MTLVQGAAVLVLWQSGRFDTADIAKALGQTEADVCRVIHAAKERARGPDLRIVAGVGA